MSKKKPANDNPSIAENRKARHEYFIEETYEAEWCCRVGRASASARVVRRSRKLTSSPSDAGGLSVRRLTCPRCRRHRRTLIPDPIRTRKLLPNKAELNRLVEAVERKGYTLVPLEMYWKNGSAKLRVGVSEGQASTTSARARKIATGRARSRCLMKHSSR